MTAEKKLKEKDNERLYPCDDCGVLRSKNEGGTVFTVCDKCWDKHYHPERHKPDS
jgi:hypothetical protein